MTCISRGKPCYMLTPKFEIIQESPFLVKESRSFYYDYKNVKDAMGEHANFLNPISEDVDSRCFDQRFMMVGDSFFAIVSETLFTKYNTLEEVEKARKHFDEATEWYADECKLGRRRKLNFEMEAILNNNADRIPDVTDDILIEKLDVPGSSLLIEKGIRTVFELKNFNIHEVDIDDSLFSFERYQWCSLIENLFALGYDFLNVKNWNGYISDEEVETIKKTRQLLYAHEEEFWEYQEDSDELIKRITGDDNAGTILRGRLIVEQIRTRHSLNAYLKWKQDGYNWF